MGERLARRTIGASYGDACLAAIDVGGVARDAMTAWSPIEREVVPRAHPAHVRSYRIFTDLYRSTKGSMLELDRNCPVE